jgi:hypothetical protein
LVAIEVEEEEEEEEEEDHASSGAPSASGRREVSRKKVFVSYSHEDELWRKRLVQQLGVLAREGLVDVWDDRKIGAGQDPLTQIHEELLQVRIAVLLLSASFLTSDFILTTEVPQLFRRHEAEGMTIYPLLIRDCPWEEVSWLRSIQLRPADAKPLARHRVAKIEQLLAEVAREIARIARS